MNNSINEKERKLLEKFMPKDKVGIRILDDTQLENVFPSCNSLLQRIEKHRRNICEISNMEYTDRDYQFDMMYDNVFSIFGKRGSGKTSTLLTLKMILKSQSSYDRILPLIIPDVIPENENILSWLMAILEDEVCSLEYQLKQIDENLAKDDGIFKNCKVNDNKSLRNKFENIKKMIYSKNFRPEISASYYEALGGAEIKTRNSYEFSKGMSQFWYEMINAINKIIKNDGRDDVPLIFIMFDDVDLNPERANELLSTIIKYLSHPNLIVITTADEELFLKVVENTFKYKLKSPFIALNYDNTKKALRQVLDEAFFDEDIEEEEKEDTMAKMYLDKVLPPSARYFLNTFSKWDDKSEFIIGFEKEINSLKLMLSHLIADFSSSIKNETTGEKDTFLYYKNNFLKFYVSFFGKTSRQIQNEWIIICEFINNVLLAVSNIGDNPGIYKRKMYYIVREFLHNSINTNSELKDAIGDINDLVNHIFYWEYSGYPFYVDYNYMSAILQEESRGKYANRGEIERQIYSVISVMALCAFVENILLILDSKEGTTISKRREHLHLGKTLENFFKWVMQNGQIVKRYSHSAYMLYLYEDFLENPKSLINFNLHNSRSVRNVLLKLENKSDFNTRFFEDFETDSDKEWDYYRTYAIMFFMLYNNIYCIDKYFLGRISYIEEVFEVPSRCTIALNMIFSEKICYIIKNNLLSQQNKEELGYGAIWPIVREKEVNYTLGKALNKAVNSVDRLNIDNKDYETTLQDLKNMAVMFKEYYIIDLDKYNKSIEGIERVIDDIAAIIVVNLRKVLTEMKRKDENAPTLSKKTLREFKRAMEELNYRTGGKLAEILYMRMMDVYASVDLVASINGEEILNEFANQIIHLINIQDNYFKNMLKKEEKSNINSADYYKQEFLNQDNPASENLYAQLLKKIEDESSMQNEIFQEIDDYIYEKIEEDVSYNG